MTMSRSLKLLCAARLHKNQLERHLELLQLLDDVESVDVVRHESLGDRLSKLRNHTFQQGYLPVSALRYFREVRRVCVEEKVDWVLGFNPVPWGTLAQAAARRSGARTVLSLIGTDVNQVQTWWGFPFLHAVRRADRVTVTGDGVRRHLIELGVEERKLFILPHSVDLERFKPRAVPARFDVLSVGQLIPLKRMDVLIDAVARLRERGLDLKLAILGKGPLENRLRQQIDSLGLGGQVELLGYVDGIEEILPSSKVFSLVSEREGVPFALMEAMASGLVPVVTNVGTIADWVEHGVDGHIVPVGDAEALAASWEQLFADGGAELDRLRKRVVARRQDFGFDAGVDVWRRVLAD